MLGPLFYLVAGVSSAVKKKNSSPFSSLFFEHTFTSSHTFHSSPSFLTHFQLSPSFFFFSSRVAFSIQKKKYILFKKQKTLTSFLFSSPSCLPFFEHTFTFFLLHGFPAPFQHIFTCLPFFEHTFTFFFNSPVSILPFF